ncbi:MAG TPA: hypothetical protein VIT21_09165 [Chthoniobacterales bacterium]
MYANHYDNPWVQARFVDFLGGRSIETARCHHLTAGDASDPQCRAPRGPRELPILFQEDADICRSLWDRDSLLADLDLEYVNFDQPAAAYLDPERAFGFQDPVARTVERLLLTFGIAPLHNLSGRGHHFIWRIRQNSAVFSRLAGLGRGTSSLWEISARSHEPDGTSVSYKLASAFAGLGLVMEYLAHRIRELAAPLCNIPVELTAVETDYGAQEREMISVDISEYGDPLHSRLVRVPFSHYLKPRHQRWLLGEELVRNLPALFCIPLFEMDWRLGVAAMRDPELTAELATRASTRIPDNTEAMENLVDEYEGSTLSDFHGWFYSQEHEPPERWPETYDRTPMEILPSCARTILTNPNELLLHPASMRLITRVMLALGWHPRHIAGLIRSKFEHDYGWGSQWLDTDPATRADFYTRLFAGLFVTGRDDLADFNCQSSQEGGTCLIADCPGNLALFRRSALARRHYEHLAHRPFNRLFLPE